MFVCVLVYVVLAFEVVGACGCVYVFLSGLCVRLRRLSVMHVCLSVFHGSKVPTNTAHLSVFELH